MVVSLPQYVDPIALAEKNAKIEGKLPLADFERMAELLFESTNQVDFQLNFFKEDGLAKIEGWVSGTLALKCQRCLQSLNWVVNAEIKLGIVNHLDRIDRLPEGYEPLLIESQEKIALKDIIEDELLLCLPSIPKHQHDCSLTNLNQYRDEFLGEKVPSRKNPFSILADFKNLEKSNGSTKK